MQSITIIFLMILLRKCHLQATILVVNAVLVFPMCVGLQPLGRERETMRSKELKHKHKHF